MLRVTIALDERAAAHIALGMGLENRIPAVVVSTSGTASVNHGPALAEAHFQRSPLISITADRPAGRRNEGLGQVAHQKNLFEAHAVLEMEIDELVSDASEIRAFAIRGWRAATAGPVHMNVPFEEPLYELKDWGRSTSDASIIGDVSSPELIIPEGLLDYLCSHDPKVLVLAGALPYDSSWSDLVPLLSDKVAAFTDVFSHLRGEDLEGSAERFLAGVHGVFPETLKPQCIVSIGLPPMNKLLRAQLKSLDAVHWHIGADETAWDFFGTGVQQWKVPAQLGLKLLLESLPDYNAYAGSWNVLLDQIRAGEQRALNSLSRPWSDWTAFSLLSERLGAQSPLGVLHFANSTAARYAQWFPWNAERLHANRGVAGIDGGLSTAVGDALSHPDKNVVLISGDLAWIYDLNGLMVKPLPSNLKVVIINNGGGNIFRWLDGPKEVGLLESHFEAPFLKNAEASAKMVGIDYFRVDETIDFIKLFDAWSNNSSPALLEIQTSGSDSSNFFQELQEAMKRAMVERGNTPQTK